MQDQISVGLSPALVWSLSWFSVFLNSLSVNSGQPHFCPQQIDDTRNENRVQDQGAKAGLRIRTRRPRVEEQVENRQGPINHWLEDLRADLIFQINEQESAADGKRGSPRNPTATTTREPGGNHDERLKLIQGESRTKGSCEMPIPATLATINRCKCVCTPVAIQARNPPEIVTSD